MIRPYRPADLAAILDVWLLAARQAYPFLDDDFFARELVEIEKTHMPIAETWVYEHSGVVVGFLALLDNEVGAIFVTPAMQGSGFGRALMDHACQLRGHLTLDVFKENTVGRRFYDRYGFRLVSEYLHEPTGQLTLRLELAAPSDALHSAES